jgi:hypothetical protein
VLQVLLQSRRLKVLETLPFAKELCSELQNFRVKITAAANETFASWREREHDDLVLATAMAGWYAERQPAMSMAPYVLRECAFLQGGMEPHIAGG